MWKLEGVRVLVLAWNVYKAHGGWIASFGLGDRLGNELVIHVAVTWLAISSRLGLMQAENDVGLS